MAIKIKNKEYLGINIPDVYARVENISLNKSTISFMLVEYAEKSENNFNKISYICDYNIKISNPFEQAYEYLKTLENFKDTEDC